MRRLGALHQPKRKAMTADQNNQQPDHDYAAELDMGDQEQQRLAKLQVLREKGIDPYPPRSKRTHTAAGAIAEYEEWEARNRGSGVGDQGSENEPAEPTEPPPQVVLVGRLRLKRPGGKVTFAHVEDESGRAQL